MTAKFPSDVVAEVEAALQALEDLVITVDFDCEDPESVRVAIQTVKSAIDTTVAAYRGHPIVESAIAELKAECEAGLYEQAERAETCIPGFSIRANKPTLH